MILLLISMLTFSGFSGHGGEVEKRLADLSEDELKVRYPAAEFEVEIRWTPSWLQPADIETIRRMKIVSPGIPRGHVNAEVLTESNRFPVQLFIRTRAGIPVAVEGIGKNEVLRSGMVEFRLTDITQFRKLPADTIRFGEMTARRDIPAGEAIFIADLRRRPVLERGASVQMVYSLNGIRIDMRCESRMAGAENEVITVQCPETGKRYDALVVNGEMVRWQKTQGNRR